MAGVVSTDVSARVKLFSTIESFGSCLYRPDFG